MTDEQVTPDQELQALMAFDDAIAAGESIQSALRLAAGRFPACAVLLADHAFMMSAESTVMTADTTALEPRILGRAEALAALRLAQQTAPANEGRDLVSLLTAIKDKGINAAVYAKSNGIGISVLTKLDRRTLDIATIPRRLVEQLAGLVDVSADQLWRYLALPPTLSSASDYKARRSPDLNRKGKQQSFTGAVETALRSRDIDRSDADSWRTGPVGPPDGG